MRCCLVAFLKDEIECISFIRSGRLFHVYGPW